MSDLVVGHHKRNKSFIGELDELMIFMYAQEERQVKELFANGKRIKGGPEKQGQEFIDSSHQF